MKNLFLTFGITLLILMGITGCGEDPVQPEKDQQTFPLTYKFINTSDTTILGGFEIYMARYYPKADSSFTTVTRIQEVGQESKYIFKEKPAYPGVNMVFLFSAMKEWPDHWPNRDEPLYQTLKWFYIEKRTVQDSSQATMSFTWPADTARTDIHEFDPDTVDENTPVGAKFNKMFRKMDKP